jgi:hypothetical protein
MSDLRIMLAIGTFFAALASANTQAICFGVAGLLMQAPLLISEAYEESWVK